MNATATVNEVTSNSKKGRKSLISSLKHPLLKKKSGYAVEENNGKVEVAEVIQKLYDTDKDKYSIITDVKLSAKDAEICFANGEFQRDLKTGKIKELAKHIRNGRWNGKIADPISFTPEKRLINGQNRLIAFLESGASELEFTVGINVDKNGTMRYTDSQQGRSPKDRLTMKLKNGENPRDPHFKESLILTTALCYSPIASKMQYGMKASFETMEKLYENENTAKFISETCELYSNVNSSSFEKQNPVLWACIFRAMHYVDRAELEKFLFLAVNPATNTTEGYHDWGKKALRAIITNYKTTGKGSGTVKKQFYATLNYYLYQFANKEECTTQKSRLLTARLKEHFLLPYEKETLGL